MMLSQYEFIGRYVPAWLAARSSEGYLDRCVTGNHYTPGTIPIEDAFAESEIAWEAYRKEWLARDLAAHREIAREARESGEDDRP